MATCGQNPYENNCNTYVIDGEMPVLIDPSHSRHLRNLLYPREGNGISSEEIDLAIITNSHPDHLEDIEAFLDKLVKIVMSREKEHYFLESGKLLFEAMRQSLPKFRIDF